MNWYNKNIEEPVRDLVKHLRNNGVNTVCSCGHEMYIQCEFVLDGHPKDVHDLLWNYLDERGMPITYKITVDVDVIDGAIFKGITISLPRPDGEDNQESVE